MSSFFEYIRRFFFPPDPQDEFKKAISDALVDAHTGLFKDDTIFRVTRATYNNPRTETGFDSRWYGERSNAEAYGYLGRDLMTSNKIKEGYKFICLSPITTGPDEPTKLNIDLLIKIFKYMIHVLYKEDKIYYSGLFKPYKIETVTDKIITMDYIANAYGIVCDNRTIPDTGHSGERNSTVLLDRIFVSELMQIVKSFPEFDNVIGVFHHKIIKHRRNQPPGFFDKECTILNGYREDALILEKRFSYKIDPKTGKKSWKPSKGGDRHLDRGPLLLNENTNNENLFELSI